MPKDLPPPPPGPSRALLDRAGEGWEKFLRRAAGEPKEHKEPEQ